VAPGPHVYYQEVEGETVLLDADRGLYFSLDSVGTRVWQLLGEGHDLEGVKNRMLAEFDVDEATLDADLTDLLQRLAAAGLVVSA
jgi:hypothetical protein